MMRRTIGIAAAAATAISIAAILPASAATPKGIDSYAAGAKATALDLSVFGQAFTVANTEAEVFSVPKALARGHALLTPVFSSDGADVASDAPETLHEDCADLPVPVPPELKAFVVCVTSEALLKDGKPSGKSSANQIVIEVQAPAAIDTTPLADVVTGVEDGLSSLVDQLAPITDNLPQDQQDQLTALHQDLTDLINGILANIAEGDVLARITLAPSASISELTDAAVSANATSNGVIVELLPDLLGGPLAVATVGTSTAGVARDAVTGKPTLSGGASLIDITFPNEGLISDVLSQITNALGETVTVATSLLPCADSNPLAAVLCFDVGTTKDLDAAQAKALGFDYGPSTVGRESSVLGLTLLAAAPNGGVVLNVGHTAAAAAAATPLPREDETPLQKARTGGSTALPLTLALLAVAAAGVVLVRRSRTI